MRHRLLPALDLLAFVLAVTGAFVLRLDGAFLHSPSLRLACLICAAVALVIKPLLFVAGGLYRRYWPYAGARDLLIAAVTISASSLILALIISAARLVAGDLLPSFPASIFALDWLLTLAFAGGMRVVGRLFTDHASLQRPPVTDEQSAHRALFTAGDHPFRVGCTEQYPVTHAPCHGHATRWGTFSSTHFGP